jgi:cytochrome c-type biogenesis protein CcmF
MTGGLLGEIFSALSFSAALVAAISYLMATRSEDAPRATWQRMGQSAFLLHAASIVGVIGTLFYLIYSHQYQYHYVWSHSSNELPVYYMISCFWEGQEGSFLLWTFWHAVLGTILQLRGGPWRDSVMAVIASVNLILASMILGIQLEGYYAEILTALAVLAPAGYLGWRFWKKEDGFGARGLLHIAGITLALITVYLSLSGKSGGFSLASLSQGFSVDRIGYAALFFLLLAYVIYGAIQTVMRVNDKTAPRLSAGETFAALAIGGLAFAALFYGIGDWKIGSSPFILLRDAMPGAPVFAGNPDFVPANGTGLNPLLQNYWMVIHPPTLFLGFASTVVPFAFVVGGLLTGRYKEWVKPAAPWTIFSVMILGVGIIMGGYWAYETLNFGGYWNWDPVENSSFVPWLLGIASLHAMIAYRKSKVFLGYTMWLVISVFIFVLYSTFLTRSGILGETSVHTFTDLGLSGQLLLLLFVYLFGIAALYLSRAKELPSLSKTIATNSAEFVLFLGVLTLIFIGIIITISTSIPVFNAVLGTHWATPSDGPFFYYRWTVWLTVILAVLSGIAQFVYWRRLEQKRARTALMRPYLIALGITLVIILAIVFATDWEFGFEDRYREWKELADVSDTALKSIARYARLAVFVFADEVYLFASVFMVVTNADLLIRLMRRNKRTRGVTGGSIAHVGFGLMLVGFLFSSGFDQVISKNVNPDELAALPQDSRIDNVLLQKGRARDIIGYQVTYLGKKEAVAPISDLTILQADPASFKVRFDDATGDAFAMTLPLDVFISPAGEIDLPKVTTFLNEKLDFLKPAHINERSLYGLRFVPRELGPTGEPVLVEDRGFTLYPEAEINPTMGLVAHPSRKILPQADIYAHVSTIPKDEEPEFKYYRWDVQPGDTMKTTRAMILFEKVSSEPPTKGAEFDLVVKAHLQILTDWGPTFKAEPEYRISADNRISVKDAYVDEIHTSFVFSGIDPEKKIINIQAQELQNPPDDIVVIQVLKKPFINILWLGTFVLTFGFLVAMVRRIRENRRAHAPEDEDSSTTADVPVPGIDTANEAAYLEAEQAVESVAAAESIDVDASNASITSTESADADSDAESHD